MWKAVAVFLIVILATAYLYIKMMKIKIESKSENYRRKDFLLTKTEKHAFDRINRAISETGLPFTVFPRMRLTDFLWAQKEDRNAYLKIQCKFVDFLVLKTPHLNPVFAVFIVNESNPSKMQSLEVIESALNSAGMKLLKVNVKDLFSDEFTQLVKEELKWQFQKNSLKSSSVQNVEET